MSRKTNTPIALTDAPQQINRQKVRNLTPRGSDPQRRDTRSGHMPAFARRRSYVE